MNVLVWVVELFSTFLRLITLAVRLFCNMFAGTWSWARSPSWRSMFMQAAASAGFRGHAAGAAFRWPGLPSSSLTMQSSFVVGAIQAYVFTVLTAVCLRGRGGRERRVIFRSRL